MKSKTSEYAVEVKNLSKKYRLYPSSFARVKEAICLGKKDFHSAFWALKDINLEVPRGKALGLVGANGAGKSTLLKVLSGTTMQTSGTFKMNGKTASLLELGTGFHMEFTGRANIYLNGSVMGMTKKEVAERADEIIEFTELGDFIDQPIRTYSSGMIMRLGFSMATAIDPEILIIDEILAVGDLHFQKKCVDRIFKFKSDDRSIIFCSHSLFDVRQICDEVVWIKDGKVEERGDPLTVTNNYANYERSLMTNEDLQMGDRELMPEGQNHPVIKSFTLANSKGEQKPRTVEAGEDLQLNIEFRIDNPEHKVLLGVAVFRTDNVLVASFPSWLNGGKAYDRPGDYKAALRLPKIRINEGEYNVVAYLFDTNEVYIYDKRQIEQSLNVVQDVNRPGIVNLDHAWEY